MHNRIASRSGPLALSLLVVAAAVWTSDDAEARGVRNTTRTSVNRNVGANRNANRNVNVNRNFNQNVNVNRNYNVHRDIDVDVDYDHYHPVATAVGVAAAATVTAAAIGTIVNSIPPSCTAVVVGGATYQQCGSTWYQPRYVGTQVSYVVVNHP